MYHKHKYKSIFTPERFLHPTTGGAAFTETETAAFSASEAETFASEAEKAATETNKLVENAYNILTEVHTNATNGDRQNAIDKVSTLKELAQQTSEYSNTAKKALDNAMAQKTIVENIHNSLNTINTQAALDKANTAVDKANMQNKKATEHHSLINQYVDLADSYINNIGGDIPVLPPTGPILPVRSRDFVSTRPNIVDKFNTYIVEICQILNIGEPLQPQILESLKQFNDDNKYKFIENVSTRFDELKKADERIKKFMERYPDIDLKKLNKNLAQLQILSILQKKDNSVLLTQELIKLMIDKTKVINENLHETMAGGSSKDIYISKYLKYKNKYLSLKNSI